MPHSVAQESKSIEDLLDSLLGNHDSRYGFGAMTCSVYDTAWVSVVTKTVAGVAQYVFPSSFIVVLQAQLPDGSWEGHFRTQNDSDTLGAVGFEVLCPTLLSLLASQGHSFDFPAKSSLLQIRAAKLARVNPKNIYKHASSALLHSLEAFHDWPAEDFDVTKVKHHMIGGSMMASPSATASYLIKAPVWDDEAEAYLRVVIECGEGMGIGAVPSAYPSTNFELLWVVSTLAEYGLLDCIMGSEKLHVVLKAIESSRSNTNGLVGFAPGIEPDLDDSAKASIVLSLAGKSGFSSRIVEEFDAARCLKTYRGERDPSVSANCNALLSLLLDSDDYTGKAGTIEKLVEFILAEWVTSNGRVKDKWNLSPYYPMMLISKAVAKVLTMIQCGDLPHLASSITELHLRSLLIDCLQHVCQEQQPNGSWGVIGPYEETSYAVLTLLNLAGLSLFGEMVQIIEKAMERGRQFLRSNEGVLCEYLWIEKITYGSQFLVDAYMLCAMHAKPEIPNQTAERRDTCTQDQM
ncbi:hypothetical protein DM02DRAFT_575678 [Periconia macrospinosa]|uniref:Ent-kaurene synthase n=1 Tax=Periconia macrospinosa TaxID=97972 RepID=A0A2V1D4R0_9PLEO|nr:hypothetical protein DM02DRAFT_575678 [Periconia macrospinosa]